MSHTDVKVKAIGDHGDGWYVHAVVGGEDRRFTFTHEEIISVPEERRCHLAPLAIELVQRRLEEGAPNTDAPEPNFMVVK